MKVAIFLMVALPYAWFYNGSNANHISRYDAILAFVEPGPGRGTFRIDQFIRAPSRNTCDWAQNRLHDRYLYSNKAPGPILLGIPVYACIYALQRAFGVDPTVPDQTYLNCYLLNLFVSVLPMALSAILFWQMLLRYVSERAALTLTFSLYLATLAFPFSTQLWGHTTALAFVVYALYLLHKRSWQAYVAAGMCVGMALLCDYLVGVTLTTLVIYLVVRRSWRRLAAFILGGGLPALAYVLYHYSCFGNLILPATFYNNPAFHQSDAVGGMFQIRELGRVLWGLTLSPYRGLFWYMPVLATITIAVKTKRSMALWVVAVVNIALYLAVNATFNGWHGGMSSGPRYLIPSLPFFFVLLALGWGATAEGWTKRVFASVFAVCLFISACNMLVVTSVTPMAFRLSERPSPLEYRVWSNPLNAFYRSLRKGFVQPMSDRLLGIRFEHPAAPLKYKIFNIGKLLGLEKCWQLAPPMLLSLLAAAAAWAMASRRVSNGRDLLPEATSDTRSSGEDSHS